MTMSSIVIFAKWSITRKITENIKHLGGMSPEGIASYYTDINRAVNETVSGNACDSL